MAVSHLICPSLWLGIALQSLEFVCRICTGILFSRLTVSTSKWMESWMVLWPVFGASMPGIHSHKYQIYNAIFYYYRDVVFYGTYNVVAATRLGGRVLVRLNDVVDASLFYFADMPTFVFPSSVFMRFQIYVCCVATSHRLVVVGRLLQKLVELVERETTLTSRYLFFTIGNET